MMTEKSYDRRGIFARFKSPGGLLDPEGNEYELFGLFLQDVMHKAGHRGYRFTSPYDVEEVLETLYGITSCSEFETRQLCILLGDYETWRDRREI